MLNSQRDFLHDQVIHVPIKSTLALLLVVLLATASACSSSANEPTVSPTPEPTLIPTSTPRPSPKVRGIATFSISAERGASFSYFEEYLAMDIAPGALPGDTNVKVSPVDVSQISYSPFDPAQIGIALDVGPAGLHLNQPALLTLALDADMVDEPFGEGELPDVPIMLVSEFGDVQALETASSTLRDDGRLAVSAEITHFGRIYQLRSSAAVDGS